MFIDTLEPRQLLTIVSAGFDPVSGVLTIVGNDKRDIVEITPLLTGDGVSASFDGTDVDFPGKIKLISINTAGAGDLISLATVIGIPAKVNAGAGPDFINGGADNETLLGGGGPDVILGARGNDFIDGGLQGDLLVGGIGNDTIIPNSGNDSDDTITGGKGNDTVDYSKSTAPVFITVGAIQKPTDESDKLYGDVNVVIGSAFDDELINGTKRGMRIEGGGGNDTLRGGSGADTLVGGAGNNTIEGFGGNDILDISAGGTNVLDGGGGSDSIIGDQDDETVTNVP